MSAQEVKVLENRVQAYRDYPEDLKAACVSALENNGGNVMATARLFNIPLETLKYWWKHSERFHELRQPSSLSLANKLENIAHNTADSLAEHDLSIVAARDKAAIVDVMVKNVQLLRGLPTSITENVDRQELTLILENSLNAIDVTPE